MTSDHSDRGRVHRIANDRPLLDAAAAHPVLWQGPQA